MNCKNCFHYKVCSLCESSKDYESCEYYCDTETTITLPIVDEKSQKKIRDMQAKGYCFVNSDFLKTLYSESAELARSKAEAPRNHSRKRK